MIDNYFRVFDILKVILLRFLPYFLALIVPIKSAIARQSVQTTSKTADSLVAKLNSATGLDKAKTYYEVVSYFRKVDFNVAEQYAQQAKHILKKTSDPVEAAYFNGALGLYHNSLSSFDSSALFLLESKNLSRDNDPYIFVNACNALGNVYISTGKAENGLKNLLDGLRVAEKHPTLKSLELKIQTNITWAYLELKRYRECIDAGMNAIRNADAAGIRTYAHYIYNNMAVSYGALGLPDSARGCIEKGISMAIAENDTQSIANAYFILGTIYANTGQYDLAINEYLKARPYRQKVGNPFYIISDLYTLADLYNKTKEYKKGIEVGLEALTLAKENNLILKQEDVHFVLAKNFEGLEDFKNASKHYGLWATAKDSIYKHANAQAIAEMNTRYETEKKEHALAETNLKIQQRNNQLMWAGGLLVLLVGITVVVYRNQRIKQQRLKLKAELAEVKSLNAIQEERLRISQELHDNIGSQLTFVSASIDSLQKSLPDDRIHELKKITTSTIQELRKTVWLINKQSATIEEFLLKLREYIPSNSIPPVQLAATGNVQTIIQAQTANHLFRILQEAVNNATKHARASHIRVTINVAGQNVTATVEDDGAGFDVQAVTTGFGLRNIERRVKTINGTLHIQSKPGATVLQITVPV